MLAIFGLLMSTLCVVLVNLGWAKRQTEYWASGCVAASAWVSSCSVILSCAFGFYGFFASSGFVILLIIGKFTKMSARWMAILSWSIFVAFWIWILISYVQLSFQYEQWKKQVPFESMTERVQEPSPSGSVEFSLYSKTYREEGWQDDRNFAIEALHTNTLDAFERAAGFGPIRAIALHPKAEHFLPDTTPPIPQRREYDPNLVSAGDELDAGREPVLDDLHHRSAANFANRDGWGYVESRNRVAGFQSHRFSELPGPEAGWQVERIDLVGLLKHEKPVVYVSESLPRMEDIGKLKTRELDFFESAGLDHVKKVDELYMRGDETLLRVIGPLRSLDQCQKCHGGKVGDLLGAFSYVLSNSKK